MEHSQLSTPVAFFIFNRPEFTAETFAEIRRARPSKLLVVADGPRADVPGESSRCMATRVIISEGVDWPCEVRENYSAENMGCFRRVASGMDWVFSQVQEAIILEDDCVPHPSFFGFCEELLDRFREDRRVMSICGDNFLRRPEAAGRAYSYRFSRMPHIWGWATWRRAWLCYDASMSRWPEFRDAGRLRERFGPRRDLLRFWDEQLEATFRGEINTWDYQWAFALLAEDGFGVVPRRNLVRNIGFSPDATHTTDPKSSIANFPVYPADQPLRHPPAVEVDLEADYRGFRAATRGRTLFRRVQGRLERMAGWLAPQAARR